MKWLQNIGGLVGYIIGAIIILPLILFVYNRFYIKNNNQADLFVKPYLEDVIEIKFDMPLNDINALNSLYKREQITTQLVTKNMGA